MEEFDRGLTQGRLSSPPLFSILMDTLIGVIKDALEVTQLDGSSSDRSPMLAFADDDVLELESEVETAIALRVAVQWER